MAWWKFWEGGRIGRERPDYYEEGLHLARQERFHDALTSFRLALKERPTDIAALQQMAVVYTRIGMVDDAIKMYRRALDLRPDIASAHYGIAFVLLNRGDSTAAAEHLEQFLEAEKPGGPEVEKRVEHARETLAGLRAGNAEEAE